MNIIPIIKHKYKILYEVKRIFNLGFTNCVIENKQENFYHEDNLDLLKEAQNKYSMKISSLVLLIRKGEKSVNIEKLIAKHFDFANKIGVNLVEIKGITDFSNIKPEEEKLIKEIILQAEINGQMPVFEIKEDFCFEENSLKKYAGKISFVLSLNKITNEIKISKNIREIRFEKEIIKNYPKNQEEIQKFFTYMENKGFKGNILISMGDETPKDLQKIIEFKELKIRRSL